MELGYRVDFLIGGRQENVYLESKDEYGFYNDTRHFLVEVHWKIVPRYLSIPLDAEALFGRLAPVCLSGRDVMTFCGEDLLLILCVHGGKHGWERLGWVCDVARVIEVNKGMDWERILDQARKMKIERMVFLGLFLASDLAGVELPEIVIRKMDAHPGVTKLASGVYSRLFQHTSTSDEFFEGIAFTLRMREHWEDKVRYCLDLGLTPTIGDWQYVTLPDSLFLLYYLIRPFRLAMKYGASL